MTTRKKLLLLASSVAMTSLIGCAALDDKTMTAAEEMPSSQVATLITKYNKEPFPVRLSFATVKAPAGGKPLRGRHFFGEDNKWKVPPGRYLVTLNADLTVSKAKPSLVVDVQAGKTYEFMGTHVGKTPYAGSVFVSVQEVPSGK